MSAVRLAGSELRRVTAGHRSALALLALVLIPMAYAGLALNTDPGSPDRAATRPVTFATPGPDEAGTFRTVSGQLAPAPVRPVELYLGPSATAPAPAPPASGAPGDPRAPYVLAGATWIGGYVLFLLLTPLSRRALAAGHGPLRVSLGGWIPAALLGVVQVCVMYAVALPALGVTPVHPITTLAFVCLVSLCFTAVVHALNAWLGRVGQFLGLVLLVLQLMAVGQATPWQAVPGVLYPAQQVLPMGYTVDALRFLVNGGASVGAVGAALAVLAGWFLLAATVAALASRRRQVWTPASLRPELVL